MKFAHACFEGVSDSGLSTLNVCDAVTVTIWDKSEPITEQDSVTNSESTCAVALKLKIVNTHACWRYSEHFLIYFCSNSSGRNTQKRHSFCFKF